jgi:nucleotide sugar dehydrogenase
MQQPFFPDFPQWCVWGGGLTGYSLAVALANKGERVAIVELSEERVSRINDRRPPFDWMPRALCTDDEEVKRRIMAIPSSNAGTASPAPCHIICVPTEQDGVAWPGALDDVSGQIASFSLPHKPYQIIIESTISPTWLDTAVHARFAAAGWTRGDHYEIGCSPRRDVFYDGALSLARVTKVIGGESPGIVAAMQRLYGLLGCRTVVAPNAHCAALTKPIENLFRETAILLAIRLAAVLPEWNVSGILELAATKWNMEHYHPSLGIGGYCVPVAHSYLQAMVGDDRKHYFPCHSDAEDSYAAMLLASIIPRLKSRRVAVLGLAYAREIKVHVRSPTLRLLRILRGAGCHFAVHDPLYSPDEICAICHVDSLEFPRDLANFDAVVLMTSQPAYDDVPFHDLAAAGGRGPFLIIDNTGAWKHRRFPPSCEYIAIGDGDRMFVQPLAEVDFA